MSIRVLIADDQPVVRDGLRFSIERGDSGIEVVAEASNGLEVLRYTESAPVDVSILDITMPELNGIEAAREKVRTKPNSRIIILSFHSSRAMVEQAMATGASGYLTKEASTQNVVEAIRRVQAGHRFLSPDIAHLFAEDDLHHARRGRTVERGAPLTPREKCVLQLIAEGLSTKEIAVKLGRSENTIHAHRNHVMAKLGFRKSADLVRYAVREGIAKP